MTPIEMIEHEKFDQFFMASVSEIYAERNDALEKVPKHKRSDVKFKRTALDSLNDLGLLYNKQKRKEAIYECAQKRSSLSHSQRDMLEYLTIKAGAKLVAYVNTPKTETPTL